MNEPMNTGNIGFSNVSSNSSSKTSNNSMIRETEKSANVIETMLHKKKINQKQLI